MQVAVYDKTVCVVVDADVFMVIDVPVEPVFQLTLPRQPVAVNVAGWPAQTVAEVTEMIRQVDGLVYVVLTVEQAELLGVAVSVWLPPVDSRLLPVKVNACGLVPVVDTVVLAAPSLIVYVLPPVFEKLSVPVNTY